MSGNEVNQGNHGGSHLEDAFDDGYQGFVDRFADKLAKLDRMRQELSSDIAQFNINFHELLHGSGDVSNEEVPVFLEQVALLMQRKRELKAAQDALEHEVRQEFDAA